MVGMAVRHHPTFAPNVTGHPHPKLREPLIKIYDRCSICLFSVFGLNLDFVRCIHGHSETKVSQLMPYWKILMLKGQLGHGGGGGGRHARNRNWLIHEAPFTRIQTFLKPQNVLHETAYCPHETRESAYSSVYKNMRFQKYPNSCGWVLKDDRF